MADSDPLEPWLIPEQEWVYFALEDDVNQEDSEY